MTSHSLFYTPLPSRGLIEVSGPDARTFLQGLVSNDMDKVTGQRSIHAAFLSPQGKFLHDLFITQRDEKFLLDCEKSRATDFLKRLMIYKLRSKVDVKDISDDYEIYAIWGKDGDLPKDRGESAQHGGAIIYRDPRLTGAGWRALHPAQSSKLNIATAEISDFADYDYHRAALGLPDGSRDLEVDRAILLENGFDELQGIDWDKGCYLGQELTARTKYRGLVRKRLLPCLADGDLPAFASPVKAVLNDGTELDAGETRSAVRGIAGKPDIVLALLRLEILEKVKKSGGLFACGGAALKPYFPDWYKTLGESA